MLEGIINTKPTSDVALIPLSTLATSQISTFEWQYVPSSQVDTCLVAQVDNWPLTPLLVSFVYIFASCLVSPSLVRHLLDRMCWVGLSINPKGVFKRK